MPAPKVPSQDLLAHFASVEADVRAAIDRVLASQRFVLGPEGEALEAEVASHGKLAFGVAVSSGTDAILASLMALAVGPGDLVVTTPYTFVATLTCVARLGARPVFVDIEPDTFNLDPVLLEAALEAHPRARLILPVHLFGQMADMRAIHACARAYDVPVLEDAAQAIGSVRAGLPVGRGSLGATLSFFPSKNLGGMGDGGMVLTDDASFARSLRLLRNQGQEPRYVCRVAGGNFRLDELQAAVLRAKLPHLETWTGARRRIASLYRAGLDALRLEPGQLRLPPEVPDSQPVYNQLVVHTAQRDALRAHLEAHGVASAVYYPVPMHVQPAFASWGFKEGDFPEAERASRETLALPMYPELSDDAVAHVVETIAQFFQGAP